MTSIVNTAVTAMVALLQSGTPVAPLVARVRLRPVAQASALAVVVRPLNSQVTEAALAPGYPVSWTSAIAVECYARSGTATATLGGAVLALQPQEVAYDFDADGDQTTCATLVFSVRHKTAGTTFS